MTVPSTAEAINAISTWLMSEARLIGDTATLDQSIVDRLRDAGLPITRFTTGVPSLHPQVDSFSTLWELGKGLTFRQFRLNPSSTQMLRDSPAFVVYEEGRAVRCRMETTPQHGEYPILADLRNAGLTDYLILPLPFSDGSNKAMSFATDRKGGFTDDEIAILEGIRHALAATMEVHHLRRMARVLMDTYVGPVAGRRVLEGAIKRGSGETIRAAIWFCDLKGFTSLSERLPAQLLIDMLNAYFDAVTPAIEAEGGEILKFIGDVLYGNVGGEKRLDFTVIGPAVNLASRLEGLTRELGRPVLVSAEFAALQAGGLEFLGEFAFKGVSETRKVYAPR